MLYADDLRVGATYDLGSYHVTIAEMLDFATRWDPQSFHLEPGGHFGGLIGSGLHSLAILQRLTVEHVYRHWAVIAGRRLGDVEWTAPLRGDTTLTGTVTIEALSPQPTKSRALVTTRGRLLTDGTQLLGATFETYVHARVSTRKDG